MDGHMLNDLSSALALLETRRSAKPRDLTGPGPSAAQLDRILSIAARVPDHGTLQPWRFVIVGDEQREALAGLLLDALAHDAPESGEAHREKEVNFAHYPGQLVVLVSAPIPNHKIPAYEQELSVGRRGNEHAARRPCSRVRRGMGDRLACLFGEGAGRIL